MFSVCHHTCCASFSTILEIYLLQEFASVDIAIAFSIQCLRSVWNQKKFLLFIQNKKKNQILKDKEFEVFPTKANKNKNWKIEINVATTIMETTTSVLYDLVISCGSFFLRDKLLTFSWCFFLNISVWLDLSKLLKKQSCHKFKCRRNWIDKISFRLPKIEWKLWRGTVTSLQLGIRGKLCYTHIVLFIQTNIVLVVFFSLLAETIFNRFQ